jgi:hypothetical protein
MVDRHNCRINVVALAWFLRHPAGILPVISTTRPEYINGIAQEIEMDRESWFEPESVTSSVDVGCKSLISICFSKIAGAPIGSPQFLGSKEESMACTLRRYEVTDSG